MSCVYALAVGTLMFIDGNYCKTAPTAPVTQPASVCFRWSSAKALVYCTLIFYDAYTLYFPVLFFL